MHDDVACMPVAILHSIQPHACSDPLIAYIVLLGCCSDAGHTTETRGSEPRPHTPSAMSGLAVTNWGNWDDYNDIHKYTNRVS